MTKKIMKCKMKIKPVILGHHRSSSHPTSPLIEPRSATEAPELKRRRGLPRDRIVCPGKGTVDGNVYLSTRGTYQQFFLLTFGKFVMAQNFMGLKQIQFNSEGQGRIFKII